ncbi:SulP family inorganic anion transporter [Synechococcus sp. H65.1]|uniref:SulP family inorganic anion transporter n=1 Tax=unclassified Synechococcus TaxID=2626047 RepID=UPI0039C0F8A0
MSGIPSASSPKQGIWARYLPLAKDSLWWLRYRREDLPGDLIAGVVSAILLVPQSMAYALLAGLPPETGLYASILPVIAYGFLGSSRALSVGPVAIIALLVASGLEPLAEPGSPEYGQLALGLALEAGLIQLGVGLLRLGFLANFLSHSVIAAFSSAAALIIALSQLRHLLGVKIANTESFWLLVQRLWQSLDGVNWATLGLGLLSIALLVYAQQKLPAQLRRWGIPPFWELLLTKSAPLAAVFLTTLLVWGLNLSERAGVAVVGSIPAGLPPLTFPQLSWPEWGSLLPTALTLSLVGFTESYAMAQALASKRRQKVDPNQDLVALGVANVAAAVSGGFPVTGGISRSVVNAQAGANSGLASVITGSLIALAMIWLMPLFTFLPQATLAAVVLVAVLGLVDFHPLLQSWRYDRGDALVWLLTFASVLAIGVERGIGLGVLASILLFLWRASRPHIAIVGQVPGTEHYRNVLRHEVITDPRILAVRVDESLFFANAAYLQEYILQEVAARPEVEQVLLVASAINFIDGSALEALTQLVERLHQMGVGFALAEVKGPVMDRLKRVGFVEKVGAERFFLSTHQAMQALKSQAMPAAASG